MRHIVKPKGDAMTNTPAPVSAEAPAPDLVKLLLFRSSDEAGIGWTPNTVVHVPAGLLHNAADTITALRAEVERLRAALEPFAEAARCYDDDVCGSNMPTSGAFYGWRLGAGVELDLTVEDLREARAALKEPAHED
jgi:hypothetical protein